MARNIVLFRGQDATEGIGLWVTNGTAAGTSEIGGIDDSSVSGANAGGVMPADLTVFGGEVLFEGEDKSLHFGLWETNGTAVGTHELTGISGAYSNGIAPVDLTVFGSEVLFEAPDSVHSFNLGLWVTDGTANSTREVGGEGDLGVEGVSAGGLDPSELAVFGNEVLFNGLDAAGSNGPSNGLWVTDGTPGNTIELTGISGASSNGLNPSDLTVFGSEVLFTGSDTAGHAGLWLTNGTAFDGTAVTFELTGINGANVNGVQATNLTVFGNEVLFEGSDTAGLLGLWVTNGTGAGTSELTGINGASTNGLQPTDFQVLNNEVLFEGRDTSGKEGLWVTNGKAAGTSELTGISGAYTGSQGLTPNDFAPLTLPTTANDFYGSGISDVLYRNNATGDTGFYAIRNGANTGWHDIGASSTTYSIVGEGDFDNTGTEDILYRNAASGDTGFYAISNGANAGWHDIGASSTAYSVVGTGDFTGDGTDDVLYRNNASGDTGFYEIVNGVNTGWHDIGASSAAYSVVGVGDFTGSGTDDILYRNNTTGDTGFYEIVNGVNSGWHDVGASS